MIKTLDTQRKSMGTTTREQKFGLGLKKEYDEIDKYCKDLKLTVASA